MSQEVVIQEEVKEGTLSDAFLKSKKLNYVNKKSTCFRGTYQHSSNNYRVVKLSKSYLNTKGIPISSLKSIGHALRIIAINYGRMDKHHPTTQHCYLS